MEEGTDYKERKELPDITYIFHTGSTDTDYEHVSKEPVKTAPGNIT